MNINESTLINTCPNCHHTDLHCYALIRATLHSCKDDSGTVQLSLLDWDQVETVDRYECLNCGKKFIDDKAKEF